MLDLIINVLTHAHGAHASLAIAPAIWMALASAAHSARKNIMEDKPNEQDERRYQAETAKWSPWTGMSSKFVKKGPDALSAAGQGFLAGWATGQNLFDASAANSGALEGDEIPADELKYLRQSDGNVVGIGPVSNSSTYGKMLTGEAKPVFISKSGAKGYWNNPY